MVFSMYLSTSEASSCDYTSAFYMLSGGGEEAHLFLDWASNPPENNVPQTYIRNYDPQEEY